MDRPPRRRGSAAGARRWPHEVRYTTALVSVVLVWTLAIWVAGPDLGAASGLLAATLVAGHLLRDRVTPAHLPYVAIFGAPLLLGGLWLS